MNGQTEYRERALAEIEAFLETVADEPLPEVQIAQMVASIRRAVDDKGGK